MLKGSSIIQFKKLLLLKKCFMVLGHQSACLCLIHKQSYVAINKTCSACPSINNPACISAAVSRLQKKTQSWIFVLSLRWIIWTGVLKSQIFCSLWVWCSGGERGRSVLMRISFVTAPLSVWVCLRSVGPALVCRSRAVRAPASAPGAQQGSRLHNRPDHWESQRLWCLPGGCGLHSDSDPALT